MKISKSDVYDFGQKLFWIVVIVYLATTLAIAINRNYQSTQEIKSLKQDISDLKQKIDRQKLLNVYYQSDTFRELEARRRLALKKPDEKVFIVPNGPQNNVVSQPGTPATNQTPQADEPNPRKWLRFLLGV